MKKHNYRGIFIAIEGLDGSGLSTQAGRLLEIFRTNGSEAYLTKEPTDNVIGGLIRGVLSGVYEVYPEALQLLFAADRSHHLSREIVPMLKGGNVVICDRYIWSSVAFGSIHLRHDWLLDINKHAIFPDISIFLRLPPKICIKRMATDRFNFELFEKVRELTEVWKGYEWLAKRYNKEVTVVDGTGTIDEVERRVVNEIRKNPKIKRILNTGKAKSKK